MKKNNTLTLSIITVCAKSVVKIWILDKMNGFQLFFAKIHFTSINDHFSLIEYNSITKHAK